MDNVKFIKTHRQALRRQRVYEVEDKWNLPQIKQQREKAKKTISRTSGTYGTIREGLIFCFIIRYSEVKKKEYCAEKYIWRNSNWKLLKFNERCKPVDERGSLKSRLKQDKPNEIYVQICYNHTVENKTKKKILKTEKQKPPVTMNNVDFSSETMEARRK